MASEEKCIGAERKIRKGKEGKEGESGKAGGRGRVKGKEKETLPSPLRALSTQWFCESFMPCLGL